MSGPPGPNTPLMPAATIQSLRSTVNDVVVSTWS